MRVASVAKAAGVLAILALSVRAAGHMRAGLDYFADAGNAIDALAQWDLDRFFADQPLMGSFSLIVRAPFVAAVFDSSLETVYMFGALPCVVAMLMLSTTLSRMLAARGRTVAVRGVIAGLLVINPLTFQALHWGHPEDLLATALVVGAALAALRERPFMAGLFLGLALATKQWALVGALPVLLAAPRRRLVIAGVAVGVAALLTVPMLVGNSAQFGSTAESATGTGPGGTMTTPWNLWWPLAHVVHPPLRGSAVYVSPYFVGVIAHPLLILLTAPMAFALWRRKERRPEDALLLLALVFLLRCMLDHWNNDYYHLPFVASLIAWESLRRPGLPGLSLAAMVLISASFWVLDNHVFADSVDAAPLLFASYVAWTLPLAIVLALELYAPRRAAALRARLAAAARRPWRGRPAEARS